MRMFSAGLSPDSMLRSHQVCGYFCGQAAVVQSHAQFCWYFLSVWAQTVGMRLFMSAFAYTGIEFRE